MTAPHVDNPTTGGEAILRIANCHGSATQYSCVRVYRDNIKIAEQRVNVHNPLLYILVRNGKHRKMLFSQLRDAGLDEGEIGMLFNLEKV